MEEKSSSIFESKHDRFLRVAGRRTNQVIYRLRVLSNCSNRYNYEYTEKEVLDIFKALEDELNLARAKFDTPRRDFAFSEGGDSEE